MKIALFHPVHLPALQYGGTERVIWWLAEALRDRGHTVLIGALEGSRGPEGTQIVPCPSSDRSALSFIRRPEVQGVDLFHFMASPEPAVWAEIQNRGIVTIHGNGQPGETFAPNTVFLSRDHARRHGRSTFVHNGINPADYRFNGDRSTHRAPLFLSKTSWRVKNLAYAMRAARLAKQKLTIAGGSRPYSLRCLSAILGFPWVGSVGGERKRALLAGASCLVFPVRWSEPFGLVVIEAMMSGTPVVATPYGSLPELVTPETGVLIDLADAEGWARALTEVPARVDPRDCRVRAEKEFSHHRMADGYVEAYQRVLRGESFA